MFPEKPVEQFRRTQRERQMLRAWNRNHAPRDTQPRPSTLRLSVQAAREGAHLVKLVQL